MLKKILLFCLLLSVSLPETLWAWNQQSNEKVTDDISGYYVIRGNMDDEFFTIRSSAADEVFNFYPMTGSFSGSYLATGDGKTLDYDNLDVRYVFQFIRQSDGNYLLRYCGCPYPCYLKVVGVDMDADRDVSVTSSPAMASHIRICKITDPNYSNYLYYLFDATYTNDTGMPFCIGSNTNPIYHVYSVAKHPNSNWDSDSRVDIVKLSDDQIPEAAKAENLKKELDWDNGTYRLCGAQGNFDYMSLQSSVSSVSSGHISENIFMQTTFDKASKDNYLFDFAKEDDGSYTMFNHGANGYVVTEKTNADDDRWGYVTVNDTKTDAAKMAIGFNFDDGSIEIRAVNNINHFFDGSKELCVTNGSDSKWAKWQIERQFTMPAEGIMGLYYSKSLTIPTGMTAYIVAGVTAGKVRLVPITSVVPANTPVILMGEAGEFYMPLAFTTKTYDDNKLHAYTAPVEGSVYIPNGNSIKKVDGSTLTEGSFYLLDADFGDGVLSDGMEITAEEPQPITGTFAVYGNSVSTYEGYQPSGYACHYDAGDLGGVNGTWWMQLDKMTDLSFLANASWSGSTVSNVDIAASQFTADGRIAAIGRNGIPEYIFVSGGSNDLCRSANGKKGNVINLGEYTDDDTNTFRGAYNVLLQKLTKAYPKSKIMCLSLFPTRFVWDWVNARGWTPIQCDESIKNIAAKYDNCYYVDMTQCGIKDSISAFTEDGDHPNKAGMKLLAQGLAQKLIEMGMITANGKESIVWPETQDAYYRIISNASDNTSAYVYPKSGNSNVADGVYNLQYYKSNTYNTLTDEDKANPALVYHIYTRGGNDNYFIKNCGMPGKPYLEMYTKSDAWSVISFTDAPTTKFSAFKLLDGIVYGNQAIQSVGNTNQYWRNGSAANGITTAAYNASNMDFDFTLERLDDAQVAWAKFCEEVNTDLGMQAGSTPGYIKQEYFEQFQAKLKAYDLTYDSNIDYTAALAELKETKENFMVEIDGVYTIDFTYHSTGEYVIPNESGSLGYSTAFDKSKLAFYFDIRRQADGNYILKNMDNTENPYILNTSSDESWYIGCGGRSTNIKMVSSPQMENTINYYCPGVFRIYAVGDGFSFNSGVSQVTTMASGLPYDIVNIKPAPVKVQTIASTGWATLYNDHNLVIPEGITAYYANSVNNENKTINLIKITDGVIPANTAVVLSGNAANYILDYTDATGTDVSADNLLQGSLAKQIVDAGCFKLTPTDGAGFSRQADDVCPAGEAYLPLSLFTQTGDYTFTFLPAVGVNKVSVTDKTDAVYYDIQGRKVEKPTRGLYIKNGQKIFVR
jgi:lysophospholipase L1-like esterase